MTTAIAMVVFDDRLDLLLHASAAGEVKPADAMVLLAIMRHTNWRTGKAPVTIAALATELGQKCPATLAERAS